MSDVAKTDWNTLGKSAVNEVLEWAKGAKEFVAEQAPELVQEVLAWGFWSNLIWAAVAAVIAVVMTIITVKLIRFALTSWDHIYSKDLEFPVVVGYIISGIAAVVFAISSCCAVYNTFYIAVAPRMYLIEYLTDLTK